MKFNILGVTLARGGSKGIPKKNLALIKNKPLIKYTLDEAKKCQMLSRYIVSTDDKDVKSFCVDEGVEVPFLRPSHLATDQATSVDALIHAVNFCEDQEKIKYDFVIELMATNPLKNKEDINNCILKLIATKADSVIGVTKLDDHHPARIKKIVNDKIEDFCVPELSSRRQDLKPEAYIRNGSIYALNRDALVKNKHRFGGRNSRPYIMPIERSINIDTPIDLLICESYLDKFATN